MHAMPQHGAMPAHVGAGYSVPPDTGSGIPGSGVGGGGGGGDGNENNRKHDIAEILQQIMNITDQSLDEAQARSVTVSHGLVTTFVFFRFFTPRPSLNHECDRRVPAAAAACPPPHPLLPLPACDPHATPDVLVLLLVLSLSSGGRRDEDPVLFLISAAAALDSPHPRVTSSANQQNLLSSSTPTHMHTSVPTHRKHTLNCHRMKPALFGVLCEIKEKTGKSIGAKHKTREKSH